MRTRRASKEIRRVALATVKPSPENDQLYRPVSAGDPEIVALANSIEEHGLREPLVLSLDHYILSGHRRRAAAELAGLTSVPVRYERVIRAKDPDRFLVLLREHNRQRVKDFSEKVREAVIDADPESCLTELVEHRRTRAKTRHVPILIPQGRARAKITEAKAPFVAAVQRVVRDLKDYWPLSIRQIHYGLLNSPPLIHASKPTSRYANDQEIVRELILKVLDVDMLNVEQKAEARDARELHGLREAVRSALRGVL